MKTLGKQQQRLYDLMKNEDCFVSFIKLFGRNAYSCQLTNDDGDIFEDVPQKRFASMLADTDRFTIREFRPCLDVDITELRVKLTPLTGNQ